MRTKKYILILSAICILILSNACTNGQKRPPVNLNNAQKEHVVKVDYSELGGVKTIPVKINGVSMDAIYDPGCSGMHMSLHELQTLLKNGKFNENDIVGFSGSQVADGSIVPNAVYQIREIEIGGKDGFKLFNIETTVSLNQEAPVLLGNAVFDQVASVEVDNINETINFTLK